MGKAEVDTRWIGQFALQGATELAPPRIVFVTGINGFGLLNCRHANSSVTSFSDGSDLTRASFSVYREELLRWNIKKARMDIERFEKELSEIEAARHAA